MRLLTSIWRTLQLPYFFFFFFLETDVLDRVLATYQDRVCGRQPFLFSCYFLWWKSRSAILVFTLRGNYACSHFLWYMKRKCVLRFLFDVDCATLQPEQLVCVVSFETPHLSAPGHNTLWLTTTIRTRSGWGIFKWRSRWTGEER